MTKCRVCQNEHSGSCASFFASQSSRVTSKVELKAKALKRVALKPAHRAKAALAIAEPVSQTEALATSTYRYRDAEARRIYQRDLMRSRRRAAGRVSA